jgi:hypothetical protein
MADVVKDAQELYKDAMDATADQRRQMGEDLEFSDPSDPQQWEKGLKGQRENDPGGARPCLVFDQTGQYVANVAGQIQKQPPSLHAIPVGGGSDKRAAEQLDGFFRHIEHSSRAGQHYTRALTSAARAGVGYLIVKPEYVNKALNYQEPRISSEGDPLKVVLDPWSVELDGSDATYGFLLLPLSHREFERRWPGKDKISFGDSEQATISDNRESIHIAEGWIAEDRKSSTVTCIGVDGGEMALSEDDYHLACQRAGTALQVTGIVKGTERVVWWRTMSGVDVLDQCRDAEGNPAPYPASAIGIVPVYGYVGWANGRMKYCGVPRRAMNAQRSYNYHMSEMHVFMGQAPKSPWTLPVRAVRGLEALWDRASVDSRAYLPYHDVDDTGAPIAAPQRTQQSTNLQNHVAGAQQAIHDIQASLGMYQASLGAPSNESSGVAIESRKQQGEAATAHFPAHLSAGLSQVGKLVMEMVPRLIDTKRQARILSFDGSPSQVTMDPGQQQAVAETDQGLSINPAVGKYDMRVVVGASYSTQRSQTQAALSEVMARNPALTPAIAPIWAGTLDIPNADKLAQVLAAMAPPAVQAILNPDADKQPQLAEVMAKLEQTQQALQEAIQHAHDAQQESDQFKAEKEQAEDDANIKAYDAETKRLVGLKDAINPAQIQQLVVQTIEQMMRQPDPMVGEPGFQEPGEQAWQPQQFPMQAPDGAAPHEQAEDPQFEQQEGVEPGERITQ